MARTSRVHFPGAYYHVMLIRDVGTLSREFSKAVASGDITLDDIRYSIEYAIVQA